MSFRQRLVLVMVWLLTLSYGMGGVLLIRQNFSSSMNQAQSNVEESYEMILKSVELVNFVDIQQDFHRRGGAFVPGRAERHSAAPGGWAELRSVQHHRGGEPYAQPCN